MIKYVTEQWADPVTVQVEETIFTTVVTITNDVPRAMDLIALVAWGQREGLVECTDREAVA